MNDEEELLLTLPTLLSDPAATLSPRELRSPILADSNPFTLVRCPGDELSIREAEEAEEGWSTMEIWAVDVPGSGTMTRDVLGVVRKLTRGPGSDVEQQDDEDEGMRHLKRVRKGKKLEGQEGFLRELLINTLLLQVMLQMLTSSGSIPSLQPTPSPSFPRP